VHCQSSSALKPSAAANRPRVRRDRRVGQSEALIRFSLLSALSMRIFTAHGGGRFRRTHGFVMAEGGAPCTRNLRLQPGAAPDPRVVRGCGELADSFHLHPSAPTANRSSDACAMLVDAGIVPGQIDYITPGTAPRKTTRWNISASPVFGDQTSRIPVSSNKVDVATPVRRGRCERFLPADAHTSGFRRPSYDVPDSRFR